MRIGPDVVGDVIVVWEQTKTTPTLVLLWLRIGSKWLLESV
jgi:hypothetical protein